MQIERCKVCGGTIISLGSYYIRCEYCGQIYDLNGKSLSDDQVYKEAINIQQDGTQDSIEQSRQLFEGILEYKDSASKAIASYADVENLKIAEEERRLKEERERQINLEKERLKEVRNRKLKMLGGVVGAVIVLAIVIAIIVSSNNHKKMQNSYDNAVSLYENGQYLEARDVFKELKEYEDSQVYLADIESILAELDEKYNEALGYYEGQGYVDAIVIFGELNGYLDSMDYVEKCAEQICLQVDDLIAQEDFETAKNLIGVIPQNCSYYSSVADKLKMIESEETRLNYERAKTLFDNGELTASQKIFIQINGYEDANNYLTQIATALYDQATQLFQNNSYEESYNMLGYIDEKTEWNDYVLATELKQTIVNTVVSNTNESAVNILTSKGWDAFEEFLSASVSSLYTNADKTQLEDEYINYKPVDLNVSDYLMTNANLVSFVGNGSDILGNSFGQSIIITRCYVSPEDNSKYYYSSNGSTLQYNVGGKYRYLSGTIACPTTNDEPREQECENSLLIFADGKLVYSSPYVNYLTNPIDFRVDIGNAQVISFVNPVYHDGYLLSDILVANLKLSN